MVTIINNGMPRKGMTKGAFGTQLTCPNLVNGLSGAPEVCSASKWEFVERVGPFRMRYRCKACHKTVIYEYSANPGHPYEAYGKNKWQRIVDNWKRTKKLGSV
jgi:rubredoxin